MSNLINETFKNNTLVGTALQLYFLSPQANWLPYQSINSLCEKPNHISQLYPSYFLQPYVRSPVPFLSIGLHEHMFKTANITTQTENLKPSRNLPSLNQIKSQPKRDNDIESKIFMREKVQLSKFLL